MYKVLNTTAVISKFVHPPIKYLISLLETPPNRRPSILRFKLINRKKIIHEENFDHGRPGCHLNHPVFFLSKGY